MAAKNPSKVVKNNRVGESSVDDHGEAPRFDRAERDRFGITT